MEEQLFVEKCSELQKNIAENGKKALQKILKEYFKENKDVLCIFWDQYTPYFNDGEECVFSVNDVTSVEILELENFPRNKETNELILPTSKEMFENKRYDSIDFDFMEDRLQKEMKEPITSEEYSRFFDIFYNSSLTKGFSKIEDVMRIIFGDHVDVFVDNNLNSLTMECKHE